MQTSYNGNCMKLKFKIKSCEKLKIYLQVLLEIYQLIFVYKSVIVYPKYEVPKGNKSTTILSLNLLQIIGCTSGITLQF